MITDEQILSAYDSCGSKRAAAQALGMPRTTFRRRYNRLKDKGKPQIVGVLPYQHVSTEDMLDDLINRQEEIEQRINLSRSQRVIIDDNQPIVLALFADLHLGNNKANYRAIKRDTELVNECPFCYSILAGDFSDNWIGKLGYIAREQSMSLDTEHALVKWWFEQIAESTIACCAGNHDNRSIIGAGIDYIREMLRDRVMLYDQDQIVFTLQLPACEVVFKVRHKDKYKSVYNPHHGAFRDVERGDCEWDVYISGHDHRATLFGEYVHHDAKKLSVRIGTYKMDDRFGKFLGFPRSYGTGSGALVVMPDKTVLHFEDIGIAIDFASMCRGDSGQKFTH